MNMIATKDIKEEVKIIPNTKYAYIELRTMINKVSIYNGSIWGIQQLILNETGMLIAQVNDDITAIILHNIRDIQVINTTTDVTQYIVYIDCIPTA